jgi:hypothetical protein
VGGIVFLSVGSYAFMKTFLYILLFALILLLTLESRAQTRKEPQKENLKKAVNTNRQTPKKMIERLVGEWAIAGIYDGKNDVTKNQGGSGQNLTFTDEARFILRSGTQKIDSGAFRMNEQLRNIYLESEGTKKVHEWDVTFRSDSLILTRAQGADKADNLKYIYIRQRESSRQK